MYKYTRRYPPARSEKEDEKKFLEKVLTFGAASRIINTVATATKTKNGPVVQLVRTLACHARGREFEPHPGRHMPL